MPRASTTSRSPLRGVGVPRFPIPAEPQPPWGPRSFHVSSISSTSSRVSPSCRTGRETSASRYRRKRPPSFSIENSLEASSRKCASRLVARKGECVASSLLPGTQGGAQGAHQRLSPGQQGGALKAATRPLSGKQGGDQRANSCLPPCPQAQQ